jgi:hypothetical protein
LAIAGKHEIQDLHFVVVTIWEHWPDRPVDEAGRERFLGRGPSFAFEKAAGELSGRCMTLAVVAGERKIVQTGTRRPAGDGAEYHSFAVLHRAAAGRLFCQCSCFNANYTFANLSLNSNSI